MRGTSHTVLFEEASVSPQTTNTMTSVASTESPVNSYTNPATQTLFADVNWTMYRTTPELSATTVTEQTNETGLIQDTWQTVTEEILNSTLAAFNSTAEANETSLAPVSEEDEIRSTSTNFEAPFLTVVCVVGLIGNILVLAVYSKKKSRRHNASLYVLNLAIGDLLALVVVAFHITEFYRPSWSVLWKSDVSCIVHRFSRYVGFNITVLTMVAIAIDRYFAICHPVKFKISFTLRRTTLILVILWFLSLVAASPTLFMFKAVYGSSDLGDTYKGKSAFACKLDMPGGKWFRHFKALYFNLVLFFMPSVVTFILNTITVIEVWKSTRTLARGDSRKTTSKYEHAHWKAARTLLVVFVAYFLSYVLLCTYNLVFIYLPENTIDPMVKNVGLLLPYANSCMNPIIYSFLNPKFRGECRVLLCRRQAREKTSTSIYIVKTEGSSDMYVSEMSVRNPIDITDE